MQKLWMGRRRGEPQQTVSSVGTTAGRHSQKGRKRASRQHEGREEGKGGVGISDTAAMVPSATA